MGLQLPQKMVYVSICTGLSRATIRAVQPHDRKKKEGYSFGLQDKFTYAGSIPVGPARIFYGTPWVYVFPWTRKQKEKFAF